MTNNNDPDGTDKEYNTEKYELDSVYDYKKAKMYERLTKRINKKYSCYG